MSDNRTRSLLPWLLGFLAIAGVLASGYVFLSPGCPAAIDIWPHLVRQQVVYESVKAGHSPFYTFLFYCGYPILRFYGPGFAFLGALVALILRGNQLAALKLLLFILHVFSATAMFFYLRYRTRCLARSCTPDVHPSSFITHHFPVLLGTLAYSLLPWRISNLIYEANYPQALIYVLLPLSFLTLEALLDRPGLRRAALLGLALGAAFVSHLIFAAYLALFLGISIPFLLADKRQALLERADPGPRQSSPWPFLLLACLLALLLAGFFLLPFLAEYRSHSFPQLSLNLRPQSPLLLLRPWTRAGGFSGRYLGIVSTVLLILSIVLLLIRRPSASHSRFDVRHSPFSSTPFFIGLLISLFLVFVSPRFGPTQALLNAGLPAERFLLFFAFFSAMLVGLGCSRFLAAGMHADTSPSLGNDPAPAQAEPTAAAPTPPTKNRRPVLALVALLLVLADSVPHLLNFRHKSAADLFPVRSEAYPLLSWQEPVRVLDLPAPDDKIDDYARLAVYPAVGYLLANLPSVLGPPYHQFAPRSMLYVYPWANLVATDLGDASIRQLSAQTVKAIHLMGISHIISLPAVLSTDSGGVAVISKDGIEWDDRYLVADRNPPLLLGRTGAGLAIASNCVCPVSREQLIPTKTFLYAQDWMQLLDALQIIPSLHLLDFIPVTPEQQMETLPGLPSLEVLSTTVQHHRVSIELAAETNCFVRLALSFYPELSVRLDGRPIEFYETKDHFIWLRFPAGYHRLEVTCSLTPLRRLTLLLSATALLLCLAAVLVPRGSSR